MTLVYPKLRPILRLILSFCGPFCNITHPEDSHIKRLARDARRKVRILLLDKTNLDVAGVFFDPQTIPLETKQTRLPGKEPGLIDRTRN